MTTLASINKTAFDAIAGAISGVIQTVVFSYETQSVYDPSTSTWGVTTTTITGRGVLDTRKPIADLFPDYVAGPSEKLIWIEGITTPPQEGWMVNFNGADYTVTRVLDVLDAHEAFYVVVK